MEPIRADVDVIQELLTSNQFVSRFREALVRPEPIVVLRDTIPAKELFADDRFGDEHLRVRRMAFRRFGKCFGPISVNPGDSDRTRLICDAFIEGKHELPLSYGNAQPINGSPEEIRDFVETIKKRADALGMPSDAAVPVQKRIDLVIGDRGIGKTFFENYVLSKFSDEFDDRRIVWVRVNLAAPWTTEKINIDYWVKSQIAKVLCRYYDPDSKRFDTRKHTKKLEIGFYNLLNDRIRARPRYDIVKLTADTRAMLTRFYFENPDAEMDICPGMVDEFIADCIYQEARNRQLRFIVVFDGLDLLGYTDVYHQKYKIILNALADYFNNVVSHAKYHLLFIRPESEPDVNEQILLPLSIDAFGEGGAGRNFGLRPIDVRAMYRARVVALSLASNADAFGVDITSLGHFDDFMKNREAVAPGPDNSSYIERLQTVMGGNARSSVQLIQNAFLEFATHGPRRTLDLQHAYAFTEDLMRAGMAYPPAGYSYMRRQQEGHVRLKRTIVPRLYETNFLTNIFRWPFASNDVASAAFEPNCGTVLLSGLRLLQTIEVLGHTKPGGAATGRCTKHWIGEVLWRCFGYTQEATEMLIEEFIEEELLSPGAQDGNVTTLPENRTLALSPKGLAILNRFCFDTAYLNLAAYNVPLPVSLMTSTRSPAVLSWARPSPLENWIVSKIQNCISMVSLIGHLNKVQSENLESRLPELKKEVPFVYDFIVSAGAEVTGRHGGMFLFVTRLKKETTDVCATILGSIRPHREIYDAVLNTLRIAP